MAHMYIQNNFLVAATQRALNIKYKANILTVKSQTTIDHDLISQFLMTTKRAHLFTSTLFYLTSSVSNKLFSKKYKSPYPSEG